MEEVFRALADPSRRLILDRLFERDGQTLAELCALLPQMTRFGVMNHVAVLDRAGLVTSQKVGREKHHFLNPVPIRLVHDRWIGKFEAPIVGAMVAIKHRLEATDMSEEPAHIYIAYIRATLEAVWDAIVDGTQTEHYYYGTRVESDWAVGSAFHYRYPDGSLAADGTIVDIEERRSVTMQFQAHWDPQLVEEGPVRMTWRVEPAGDDVTKLSVSYGVMGPRTRAQFVPGIAYIVSGLKSLLETGAPLPAQD